jgi:putative transposase
MQIIGGLLDAPPCNGELSRQLEALARVTYAHPLTQEPVRFGVSTIERWYYQARKARGDVMRALERRVRSDAGTQRSLSVEIRQQLDAQCRLSPDWTYQEHYDGLVRLSAGDPTLPAVPSYTTVRRYLVRRGVKARS